jgi:hypothetical protein
MTQRTEMKQCASLAIHGLMDAADRIDQALLGEKRSLNAHSAERTGPFAQAMYRLAAIADGAAIEDIEAVRADLLFTFPLMRALCGGFYTATQKVLFAAHLRCADLLTREQAEAILGEHKVWLDLAVRQGHIHPLVRTDDQEWRGYDATYLGLPDEWYEVRYARYEIQALRAQYDKEREILATRTRPGGTSQA